MSEVKNIPDGWVETTLGEVSIKKQYGYTESASLEKIGPKFLRITDIQNDFINWETVPYCPISDLDYEKYKVKIGDIVIARTGNSTGATTVIKENIDAVFASFLIRFQLNNKLADYNFIDFLLRSTYWKGFVNSVKSGSAQGGANANDFATFTFLLPKLPEQKSIASILTAFDNKIELLQAQNKTLEETAQTIFAEWFGKYSVDDELPEGWSVEALGTISTLSAGGDRPKNTTSHPTEKNSIPIYSNGITNYGLYGFTDIPKVSEESVTVSARGTIGFPCLRTKPYVPIVRLIAIIPNQKYLSSKYLFLWLKNQNISGTGTTQEQLTIPDFKRTKIIIPQFELMEKFSTLMNTVYNKIDINITLIQTLTKTRDELLPRLMSGEIRVNEFKV